MRRQCYAAGMTDEELRPLLRRGGPWAVVRPGAYVRREQWEVSGEQVRAALRDRAASLAMETEHVLSHDSAARALGVPLLRDPRPLVHVTRPGVGGSRTKAGVKHHLTRVELPLEHVVQGMAITPPARTALDLAREHGLLGGVVAMDHVLARGTPRRELERELRCMWSWPHVRTVREALLLADAGAESPAETLARLLVLEIAAELGLGAVETQWPVYCHGATFWTDLRLGCQVVEVEGVAKLVPTADGGLATRSTTAVLRARENRTRLIRGEGLGVAWVGWDDLWGRRRAHTKEWLTRETRLTTERYGPTLPTHLAERAAHIRRRSPRIRPGA